MKPTHLSGMLYSIQIMYTVILIMTFHVASANIKMIELKIENTSLAKVLLEAGVIKVIEWSYGEELCQGNQLAQSYA